jgi:uncharacterized protein (TIGR03790 family)
VLRATLLSLAVLLCGVSALSLVDTAAASTMVPYGRAPHLTSADVGVVINTADPLSEQIGTYYVRARHIPKENVVRVRFEPGRDDLSPSEFAVLRVGIERQIGARVQAYALTWARPYRVGCMSITSAFAFGFDRKYCAEGCVPTERSPYFNSPITHPFDSLGIHPAMTISAVDFSHAKALIDRGVSAESQPLAGTAYLVTTDDKARNVRSAEYPGAVSAFSDAVNFEIVHTPGLKDRGDVLFYFIGAVTVPDLQSNRFVPGAVADHLTSFGGMLTDSSQMSSLRWLEAGATGTYGTVVEPCSFPGKFPDVRVLMAHYLGGETLVEAYWKSVLMPGQGLFLGEPLAVLGPLLFAPSNAPSRQ